MGVVSMKQLLECGVHFGHQTRRWNPKMKPFIFTERNGIYIIDLQKTVKGLEKAYDFVREVSKSGGSILFVGTKRQAQDPIRDEALKAGQFYINQRWRGGRRPNFAAKRRPGPPYSAPGLHPRRWKRTAASTSTRKKRSFSSAKSAISLRSTSPASKT